MVRISYLEITARTDYPTVGRPDLHLWEPTLQTLERQSFKDFEYIVIDVFYHERPDYFKQHSHGLRIKHIPSGPYVWNDLGICQTAHQFNKGVIHADGELIFMGADSGMYPPQFFENVWRHYKDEAWFVSAGFGADLTHAKHLVEGVNALGQEKKTLIDSKDEDPLIPIDWYSFLGFHGPVRMDHRYEALFRGNTTKGARITPQWYFGISSVSLKAMLEVNGFDEAFDGSVALSDIDLGFRLALAGYDRLAMFRDVYTVEAYAGSEWHPKMRMPKPEILCCYALLRASQHLKRYRANQGSPAPEADLEKWMIDEICHKRCELLQTCREKCQQRAPFYNKNETELYKVWRENVLRNRFNLELEREMRISGDEHGEGTFVNV